MNSDKRKLTEDKELCSIFWKLSSASIAEREKASIELLHILSLVHDSSKQNGLQNSEQTAENRLQYSLERLQKGLGGIKTEAKLGFSLALTLLLEKLHKNQVRSAFGLAQKCLIELKTETKLEASSKKIGLCFLLLAYTGSGAFKKLKQAQKSSMLDQVAPLLEEQPMADFASLALSTTAEMLTPEEFNPCLFAKLSARLACGWDSLDANGLLLLLCCYRHHKEAMGRGFIKSHYATKHLISREHFDHYMRIAMASNEGRETLSNAQLHPGIAQLLDSLLAKSVQLLAEFVATAGAAAATAAADVPARRKAVALNLIGWTADCPAERFPDNDDQGKEEAKAACLSECLANPDVCRQVRMHAASQSSLLHAFARRLLSDRLLPQMALRRLSDAELAAIAGRFLDADCLFDAGLPVECRVLRGDTVPRLPLDLLDDCAKRIELTLAGGDGEISNADADTEAAAISGVARARATCAVQTLRQLATGRALLCARPKASARMLLCLADRFLGGSAGAATGAAGAARSAFCRSLDSLSGSASATAPAAALTAYRRCLRLLAKGLGQRLTSLTGTPKETEATKAAGLCLSRGLELLPASASEDGGDDGSALASRGMDWCFAVAFLHLGFHLLPGGDEAGGADADALIADLDECRRLSVDGGAAVGAGKPKWSDVLFDSFLGLLAASRSHLLRSVASLVARQVAPLVTLEGVAALTQLLLEGDANDGRDDGGNEESDEEGEPIDGNEDNDNDSEESEISIGDEDSDSAEQTVDPEFRRACKTALGEAACPSDAGSDVDPSDLSDSAMERVDDALALAFRFNGPMGGPGKGRRGKAAALERRRRQCQARLRALDMAEALLAGGVGADCRVALAACLARLALSAVGADGGAGAGGFWSAAPAGEREQVRQRAISLLKSAATTVAESSSTPTSNDAADAEICLAAEAALAANLRAPLPAKIAQTAADALSYLLRVRPTPVESRIAEALSRQLSTSATSASPSPSRPRLGGLALWQRVCAERPRLLRRLRSRLLDLLNGDGDLRPFDLAAIVSLAVCLAQGDVNVEADSAENADADFYRRLAEWTFARLASEAAGVTSARLLAALLALAAALLRLRRRQQARHAEIPIPPTDLAERLEALQTGCRNRDLRRGLHACLTAMTGVGATKATAGSLAADAAAQVAKRQANQQEKRRERKRQKLAPSADGVEKMDVEMADVQN